MLSNRAKQPHYCNAHNPPKGGNKYHLHNKGKKHQHILLAAETHILIYTHLNDFDYIIFLYKKIIYENIYAYV